MACIRGDQFALNVWSPNMSGRITSVRGWAHNIQLEGVFTSSYIRDGVLNEVSGDEDDAMDIAFSASDGNAIYSGNYVQSPALQVLACIRI